MEDIRLISSTPAARINTTSQAGIASVIQGTAAGALVAMLNPGVLLGTAIGGLASAACYLFGSAALNGYVRYFTWKDYSINEKRCEQYFYLSKTDADNDNGGEFLGATDPDAVIDYYSGGH